MFTDVHDPSRIPAFPQFSSPLENVSLHIVSLGATDLLALVLTRGVLVVLLVDSARLTHSRANLLQAPKPSIAPAAATGDAPAVEDCAGAAAAAAATLPYHGHYVLLAGADAQRGTYTILDPARAVGRIEVPVSEIEDARRAFGTDEDVLVVAWPEEASGEEDEEDEGGEGGGS